MATQNFQIEKNVPAPSAGNAKYPWRQMAIGDSFFVPNVSTQKMSNAASARKTRGVGTFTCRAEEGGVRVWRIA